jgi:hypothetical protein
VSQGVILAPQSWGLLGMLATYQHTLWGAGSELTTVQPIAFYNIKDGYYLRSSAIMTFDTYGHTTTILVGFGGGKVFKLDGGYVLNVFAEAQPSIYRAGKGGPAVAERRTLPSRSQYSRESSAAVTDHSDEIAKLVLVARVIEYEGMTQKRQCHARESGHPDLAARAGALDSRLRGNDTTLENLILNDAPH